MVKYSDAGFDTWPLYGMPKEALSWGSVRGVTLIGDAAHLTIPSGEGANAALYDAFKLAGQIKEFGLDGLDLAVAEYEKEMHPRALDLHQKAEMLATLLNSLDSPSDGWQRFVEQQEAAEAK